VLLLLLERPWVLVLVREKLGQVLLLPQ